MCISVDGVSQAEETVGARSFLGIYFVSRPKWMHFMLPLQKNLEANIPKYQPVLVATAWDFRILKTVLTVGSQAFAEHASVRWSSVDAEWNLPTLYISIVGYHICWLSVFEATSVHLTSNSTSLLQVIRWQFECLPNDEVHLLKALQYALNLMRYI